MELSEFAFRLLLIFFPGVLCTFMIDQLTIHRPRKPFFFIVHSFTYGLSTYFIYWLILIIINRISGISYEMLFIKALSDSNSTISFIEILFACIISIPLSLGISWASKHKSFNKIARKIKITNKAGELDLWGYMFNMDEIQWVLVRDHNNDLLYEGWVQAFSDDSVDAEIILRDVSVYKNSNAEKLYQVGLLYLSRKRENITIECRTIPFDDTLKWKEDTINAQQTAQ